MPRTALRAVPLAVLGAMALACLPRPAAAQLGSIFGDQPPRPPSSVPGGQPYRPPPPRYVPPPQYVHPPPQLPPPQQQTAFPSRPPDSGIQSESLPPPPGEAPPRSPPPLVAPEPQPAALPQAIAPQPGRQVPSHGVPPPAAPANPSQPANAPPQSDDVVITEPPTQHIDNPTAVFSGLDKITGRITSFDVAINETVQFGALQVTPRACYTRPPTETPNTDGFVEVDEVTLKGDVKRIFTGWMFAASPGLHAVEHPIYDVWLTDCKGGTPAVAEAPPPARAPAPHRPPPRPPQRHPVPPPFQHFGR